MNNYFITQHPYAVTRRDSSLINLVNKGLRVLKAKFIIQPLDAGMDMNTIEQRINFYHLLDSVLVNEVAGDVVELGCFTGQCALLFQKVMDNRESEKQLHLYDNFSDTFRVKGSVENHLKSNFQRAQLKFPVLHKGNFMETLPMELPNRIAFAHIDCGHGGDKYEHKNILLHCLKSVYPRMSKGAICVLMDYHDINENPQGIDINAGVKLACDEFFSDKPEDIVCLFGNQYNHAYFRKSQGEPQMHSRANTQGSAIQ